LIYHPFGPHFPSMPMDDALYSSQPNSGALKLISPMQALKHPEKLVGILHVKPSAIIGNEYLDLIVLAFGTANSDFGL
jgi:hypothetical protein